MEVKAVIYNPKIVVSELFKMKIIKRIFEDYFEKYVVKHGRSANLPEKITKLSDLLNKTLNLEGDIIECGVYRGGSLLKIAEVVNKHKSKKLIFGLDTFSGLPEPSTTDKRPSCPDWIRKNKWGDTRFKIVKKLFYKRKYDNVFFLRGLFKDTLPYFSNLKFSFVHIDADLYESISECIKFVKPRLVNGGIILVDDYNSPHYAPGANQAVHENLEGFIPFDPRIAGGYWRKGD